MRLESQWADMDSAEWLDGVYHFQNRELLGRFRKPKAAVQSSLTHHNTTAVQRLENLGKIWPRHFGAPSNLCVGVRSHRIARQKNDCPQGVFDSLRKHRE